MATKKFWGRHKTGKKWEELWHLVKGANSELEAKALMLKGTRYTFDQVEITDKEPAKYAGKNAPGDKKK